MCLKKTLFATSCFNVCFLFVGVIFAEAYQISWLSLFCLLKFAFKFKVFLWIAHKMREFCSGSIWQFK